MLFKKARENNTQIEVTLVIGEKVSKKSMFSLCLKPLANSLALNYCSIRFEFFFRIHLQPIA